VTGDETAVEKISVVEIDVPKISAVEVALDNPGAAKTGVPKVGRGKHAVLQVRVPKPYRRKLGVIEEAEAQETVRKIAVGKDGVAEIAGYKLLVLKRKPREGDVREVEVEMIVVPGQEVADLLQESFRVRGMEKTVVAVENPGSVAVGVPAENEGKHASA